MKIHPNDARKYIDPILKLLDPSHRELAPATGDLGCSRGVVRKIDAANRTLDAVVSTPNVDRYEEIVLPAAFEKWLGRFMENPVFIAGHQYGGRSGEPTVIGHWKEMRVAEEGVVGKAVFADTPLANQYWQLYEQGHMRAFSVGWITHGWEWRDPNDIKAIAKATGPKIRVFTEVELIEVSAVAIPANRESLVRAASALRGGEPDGATLPESLMPAIREEITKTLTDPLGPVDSLIREVVAAVHAHGSCGHDDDLDGRGKEPGRASADDGQDTLKDALRELVG
jgi:HK97 family phage prohead protease